MLYLLYKIGLALLRSVNLGAAYRIVSFCAKIKYNLSKRDREIVKSNLRNIISGANEKKISLLATEVFKNFGKYLVDFFSLTKDRKGYLKDTVRLIGLENLEEVLRLGKGCILISGHFGNWELAGCALADAGFKINVIALAHLDRRINNLFIGQRKKSGMNVMPIGTARTTCQRALRQNEVVGILGDRPYGDRGIKVMFLGRQATVPRGAALLSLKNGSPIVLLFSYKEDTGKNLHNVVLEKLEKIERKGNLKQQLEYITQSFINRFEYYIQKYPSQWYMFHKVWEENQHIAD